MIERDEVFRIRTSRRPGTLARALTRIADFGAHIGEIETLVVTREYNVRDVTVIAPGDEAVEQIRVALTGIEGVELLPGSVDKVFAVHEGGKIGIHATVDVHNLQDMREVYTPGVARVASAIATDPGLADRYTWRGRTVAVVSDGSRVLGLGPVGPAAALPVMEGKALFYAMLVGLNAVPLVIDTHDPDEIIDTVARLAPGFGGIHLEDIATPGAYRIEAELGERLGIPVMHDDQHGTAVVVLAAVLSAARLLGRDLGDLTFGQVGLGAAGSAIAALAQSCAFRRILAFDPHAEATDRLRSLVDGAMAPLETRSDEAGFESVVADSDVLVLSTGRPGLLPAEQVRTGQVVIAITNPIPEIEIEAALAAGAAIAADGSIVNNVLAYPGLFKGALDARARRITVAMRRAAAEALTAMAGDGALLPDALSPAVHAEVARRVAAAATGGTG